MIIYEFREDEQVGTVASKLIVDLDALVMLQEVPYEGVTRLDVSPLGRRIFSD